MHKSKEILMLYCTKRACLIDSLFDTTFFPPFITIMTAFVVQWLACLTIIRVVPGSIPRHALEIFLGVSLKGLERDPSNLVRSIG